MLLDHHGCTLVNASAELKDRARGMCKAIVSACSSSVLPRSHSTLAFWIRLQRKSSHIVIVIPDFTLINHVTIFADSSALAPM